MRSKQAGKSTEAKNQKRREAKKQRNMEKQKSKESGNTIIKKQTKKTYTTNNSSSFSTAMLDYQRLMRIKLTAPMVFFSEVFGSNNGEVSMACPTKQAPQLRFRKITMK